MVIFSIAPAVPFWYEWLMEKLSQYLEHNKLTYEQFADLIGSTSTSVYRYAKGLRIPESEQMRRIYDVTGGKVSANDFYGISGDRPCS